MRQFFLFSCILVAATAFGQSLQDDLDLYTKEAIEENHLAGLAVAVVQNGKVIYQKCLGYANIETKDPFTSSHQFPLGSTGQMFSAIAALTLVEKGKLNLDSAEDGVTLRHLLSHTAGYADFSDDPSYDKDPATFEELAKLATKKRGTPGKEFSYSEGDNLFLTHLLEKTSGKKLYDFVESTLFEPAGMKQTAPWIISKVKGYSESDSKKQTPQADHSMENAKLTGSHFTASLTDMIKWDQAVNSNLLIKKSTWDVATKATVLKFGPIEFGLGFDVSTADDPDRWFGREGGIDGFSSSYLRFPDKKLGIIVFANNSGAPTLEIAKELYGLVYRDDVQGGGLRFW